MFSNFVDLNLGTNHHSMANILTVPVLVSLKKLGVENQCVVLNVILNHCFRAAYKTCSARQRSQWGWILLQKQKHSIVCLRVVRKFMQFSYFFTSNYCMLIVSKVYIIEHNHSIYQNVCR